MWFLWDRVLEQLYLSVATVGPKAVERFPELASDVKKSVEDFLHNCEKKHPGGEYLVDHIRQIIKYDVEGKLIEECVLDLRIVYQKLLAEKVELKTRFQLPADLTPAPNAHTNSASPTGGQYEQSALDTMIAFLVDLQSKGSGGTSLSQQEIVDGLGFLRYSLRSKPDEHDLLLDAVWHTFGVAAVCDVIERTPTTKEAHLERGKGAKPFSKRFNEWQTMR